MLPIVILAGGLGTRLGSLTENTPKCLLKVNQKPFIELQLELLREAGYSNVFLCLSHHAEKVVAHLGNGKRFDIDIEYSFDGSSQLGTGGAIRKVLPKLGPEFAVIYGDSYLPIDYKTVEIIKLIDSVEIESMVDLLVEIKLNNGRLFVLGVGGSAANASHAVNDFRKLAGIETYAPTDNVAELTARTNDEGWSTVFSGWLQVSNLNNKDCLLILSVGGGSKENNVSTNLIEGIDLAKARGAKVIGIVGRDGGYTAKNSDVCLVIPTVNPEKVTPHSESFQTIIWHLLVSHPKLKANPTKW